MGAAPSLHLLTQRSSMLLLYLFPTEPGRWHAVAQNSWVKKSIAIWSILVSLAVIRDRVRPTYTCFVHSGRCCKGESRISLRGRGCAPKHRLVHTSCSAICTRLWSTALREGGRGWPPALMPGSTSAGNKGGGGRSCSGNAGQPENSTHIHS